MAVALGALAAACNAAPASGPTPGEPPIAAEYRARCGQCHVRVEPGSRTRAQIDAALPRHHKRVHFTDEQWGALADYLAP